MNLKNLRLVCFFAIIGLVSISLQARSGKSTNPNFGLTDTIWPPTDTIVIFEPITDSEKLRMLEPRMKKLQPGRIALDSAIAQYCDSLVYFFRANTALPGTIVIKELVALRCPIAYERILSNFCLYRQYRGPTNAARMINILNGGYERRDYPFLRAIENEDENYIKNLIFHFFQNWRNYQIDDQVCLLSYCDLFIRDKSYYEYCVREFPPLNEQERAIYAKIDKIVKKTN